jgi:addiction module RelE/StbE family toxin
MQIFFSKEFAKYIARHPLAAKAARERVKSFTDNIFAPLLNNHPLHGEFAGSRSINITGDIRAVYKKIEPDSVYFYKIGTHSELYM